MYLLIFQFIFEAVINFTRLEVYNYDNKQLDSILQNIKFHLLLNKC